ncbi:MAG: DUF2306 domain-containing protein [Hyphomonadaceae bacterium]|nr:DUF2306 domain-containing protein [Hyphomonadaceae bacterium]
MKTPAPNKRLAHKILMTSRASWFVAAMIGQWVFIYFIVGYYYTRTFAGDFEAWNDKPLIDGHTSGDSVGNLMFGAHVIIAAIMTLGGTLQLIPQLRNRFRAFHRWNGRVFLVTAILLALGGLYMEWVRGAYLNLTGAVAITVDAVLILWFAVMTWRLAMARRIADHQRWALRLFMVANGVWMMRIGYGAWILLTKGWGVGPALDGPFDTFLAFAAHLLPLAILEIYMWVRDRGGAGAKYAMSALLAAAAFITAIGAFGAWMMMWGPYL